MLLDFIMLIVLLMNLIFMGIDVLFNIGFISSFLQSNISILYNSYLPISEDFLYYDMWFVYIYINEFICRWAISIKRKEYFRWYIFPILHWYDVIGCIPLYSFRLCRLLRIIAVVIKLHKLKKIRIEHFIIYKRIKEVKDIIAEEITDMVIIVLLNRLQTGIKFGSKLSDDIVKTVIIQPRKSRTVKWFLDKLFSVVSSKWASNIAIESIEITKGHIAIKRWKENNDEKRDD